MVRLATAADIPALRTLIERSTRALSEPYYSGREIEAALRHVFGVDSRLIEDATYYVADLGACMAGCGGWSRRRTLYGGDQRPVGAPMLLDPSTDAARIRAFFVAPEAARCGVGRRLLAECTRAAHAAGFRALELMATLPGVPFYRHMGFAEVEAVTDILPDGTAIRFVRMQRRLPEQDEASRTE